MNRHDQLIALERSACEALSSTGEAAVSRLVVDSEIGHSQTFSVRRYHARGV